MTETATHLEREIWQQPAVWRATAGVVAERSGDLDDFLAPLLADARAQILLTGAGTSAYAGQVVAPALTRHLRRPVQAVATTDLVADPYGHLTPGAATLLVSYARSGDSPESVAATELADQLPGPVSHLVLTCNPDGQLARTHRHRGSSLVLEMPAEANDRSFAMTSSFTCMTLASLLALDGGHRDPGQRAEVLAAAAAGLLDQADSISALIGPGTDRVVYVGSGSLHGLARESALKLTELTAGDVVALGESPLGFRHGPKAVLTPATLAVVYLSNDPYTRRYDLDILAELADALGFDRIAAVDGSGTPADLPRPGLRVIGLSGTSGQPDAYWALPAVLVAQLVGLAGSRAHGHTPDNPFPGGQVNRVVRGVTIHPLPATTPW